MIDLRNDLYAHLVISAQKDKSLNRRFRVVHADVPRKRLTLAPAPNTLLLSQPISVPKLVAGTDEVPAGDNANILFNHVAPIPSVDDMVADVPSRNVAAIRPESIQSGDSVPVKVPAKIPAAEKIDEKVDSIINDPGLSGLRMELDIAEALLGKVKSADPHNPKIPMIEATIMRLNSMLAQKQYV